MTQAHQNRASSFDSTSSSVVFALSLVAPRTRSVFCCSAEKHPKLAGTEICSRTNQNQDEGPDPEHAHPSPISAEAAAHL